MLDEQRIVVTGAASGLGKTMAEAFLDEGADVLFADLPDSDLRETVADMTDSPGTACSVSADVRSWDDVQNMVQTAIDEFGGVDVLVNNAGVRQLSFDEALPVQDVPIDVWNTVVGTNLTGTFFCTKAVLPHMLETDRGTIIHMSSGHWPDGRARAAPYCATKFGIEGFARSLADELDGTAVQSIVLEPGGAVDTGLVAELDESKRRDRMDPSVIAGPAVRLASGEGANGERYIATEM